MHLRKQKLSNTNIYILYDFIIQIIVGIISIAIFGLHIGEAPKILYPI